MPQSGVIASFNATFSAERSSIAQASVWLRKISLHYCIPKDALSRLDICLNEAMANIVSHGGPGVLAHKIELSLIFPDQVNIHSAELRISDAGSRFDPTVSRSHEKALSLADAQPGGLGLVMLRDNADALHYTHANGRNALTIFVRWSATKGNTD